MNKYQYKVQGVDYDVEIEDVEGNIAKVLVNGISFEVEMKQPIKAAPKVKPVTPAPKPAPSAKPSPAAAPRPAAAPAAVGASVKAPLPGTIIDVMVSVGDTVKAGDTVVILEAMKMQNNIEAEESGTVTAIHVGKGDNVMEGTALVSIG